MASVKIVVVLAAVILGLLSMGTNALPVPDSAGMVELPPGLAYGGIPYGSVSGMLAASEHNQQELHQPGAYYAYNNLQSEASVLVPSARISVGY